jgi:hypothetical protein
VREVAVGNPLGDDVHARRVDAHAHEVDDARMPNSPILFIKSIN